MAVMHADMPVVRMLMQQVNMPAAVGQSVMDCCWQALQPYVPAGVTLPNEPYELSGRTVAMLVSLVSGWHNEKPQDVNKCVVGHSHNKLVRERCISSSHHRMMMKANEAYTLDPTRLPWLKDVAQPSKVTSFVTTYAICACSLPL
eukprot:jgi/Chrzof1/12443/Cz06g34250.t1